MELIELNRAIMEHNLDNFYIFTGEEINLMNLYLNQISDNERVDTVLEIWSKLTSTGKFTKPKFKTYVVRDDMDFLKNEKAWSNISKIKNGRLVLLYTDIKKTTKFYKHFKDIIVEFKHLTTAQLYHQLQQNPKYAIIANADKNILEYFIESCNNDLNTIDNEVDKYTRLKDSEVVTAFDKNTIDTLIQVVNEIDNINDIEQLYIYEPDDIIDVFFDNSTFKNNIIINLFNWLDSDQAKVRWIECNLFCLASNKKLYDKIFNINDNYFLSTIDLNKLTLNDIQC